MRDYLVRGIDKFRPIRAFACKTTDLVEKARILHDLWPTSSAALGRTMSAALMMGAMEKDHSKLTITINGGGPIGTILCVIDGNGKVKGFVGEPHCMYTNNHTGKLDVGFAVGKQGYLQIIRDMGLKEPFISQVPLQTGEIGDDFTMYFAASEQTPSVVSLGVLVGTENQILASGGFIIQLMPGATESDIVYLENALKDFPAVSSLVEAGLTPEEILKKLLPDVEILAQQDLEFECSCSKDHYANALMTLGAKEIKDMLETEGGCEVNCQFCGKKYYFNKNDLEVILSQLQNN